MKLALSLLLDSPWTPSLLTLLNPEAQASTWTPFQAFHAPVLLQPHCSAPGLPHHPEGRASFLHPDYIPPLPPRAFLLQCLRFCSSSLFAVCSLGSLPGSHCTCCPLWFSKTPSPDRGPSPQVKEPQEGPQCTFGFIGTHAHFVGKESIAEGFLIPESLRATAQRLRCPSFHPTFPSILPSPIPPFPPFHSLFHPL